MNSILYTYFYIVGFCTTVMVVATVGDFIVSNVYEYFKNNKDYFKRRFLK